MIKPQTLWNFLKTCNDPVKVGRICMAVGRQEVPDMTPDERLIVQMINNDSAWMDENTELRKQKDRERKRAAAEKKRKSKDGSRSADSADSEDSTDSAYIHPSIHPSFHKKEDDGGDITRTREGRFSTPTMDTVLAFAADDTRHAVGKIDEQWAREWYTLMAETDPPWCDLHGRTIVSWQRRLISDWRLERRRREGGNGGKGGKGRPAGNGERGGGYIDPNFKPLETVKF